MSNDNFKGAWVFISHSKKDFEKVRRVRNEFETLGHRPILFFLKCMESDPDKAMNLIFSEIEAREWFMLCKSKNSVKSPYVQEEVKYIKSLKGKVYEQLDLNDKWEKQREKIHALSKRATIFMSYSFIDEEFAKAIANTLLEHDFGVWPDLFKYEYNIVDWLCKFIEEIEEAVEKGFLLILLSPEIFRSEIVRKQLTAFIYKMEEKDREILNIIPIILRNRQEVFNMLTSVNFFLSLRLKEDQIFDFTEGLFDDNMAKLIEYLRTVKM